MRPDPARRQPAAAARRARRARSPSPTSTRRSTRAARRRAARSPTVADAGGRPHRLRRPPLRDAAARGVLLPRRVRRLPRLPRAAPGARCAGCSRPTGTLYFHIDYREAHYCKLLLDELFGRECFLNELIWAYDYGGQAAHPLAGQARHDPRLRQGRRAATSSTPRRSTASRTWRPASSRPSSASAGSAPPDVWWHTIVSPTGAREDRLPDAEAGGHRAPHGAGVVAARATSASTPSPARARSARSRPSSAAATC